MTLYPYQQELCAGVLAALERSKRGGWPKGKPRKPKAQLRMPNDKLTDGGHKTHE